MRCHSALPVHAAGGGDDLVYYLDGMSLNVGRISCIASSYRSILKIA